MIGSHNTMTYLKPRAWWMYLINSWAKCQDKTLEEQLKKVRCFDFRIYYNSKKNKWYFAHGLVEYNMDLITALEIVMNNKRRKNIYIRIIMEKGKEIDKFKDLCRVIEVQFPNINFFGGNRKSDWKKIYSFSTGITDDKVNQWVSSMQPCCKLITPKRYAALNNLVNLTKASKGINLFDFI